MVGRSIIITDERILSTSIKDIPLSLKWEQNNKETQKNQDTVLRIGSCNIGKLCNNLTELLKTLKARNLDLVCLQDVKISGKDCKDVGEEYTYYYNSYNSEIESEEQQKNHYGVGVLLDSSLKKYVSKVENINDRIILVRLMIRDIELNVASVYPPQASCDKKTKEKFWNDFSNLMIKIPRGQELILGGDFNSPVGNNNRGCERVHGGWGHGKRNTEGETLLRIALIYNLAIVNTFKDALLHPNRGNGDRKKRENNYFLTRKRKISCVKECQVLPLQDLNVHQKLLLLEMKFKAPTKKIEKDVVSKINWHMLEKEEYTNKIKEQIDTMNGKTVNESWRDMIECMSSIFMEI